MNHQFRQAVTSTAFNLTLSKTMIIALVSTANGDRMRIDVFRHLGMVDSSHTASEALRRRGLIESLNLDFPGIFTLTQAGKLTLELLKEADLICNIETALAKKKVDMDLKW